MTTKQLLKYEGKYIKIEMHIFPHSVLRKYLEGVLTPEPGTHSIIRNGCTKTYHHLDFYIFPNEGKAHLIEWSEVKLITNIELV